MAPKKTEATAAQEKIVKLTWDTKRKGIALANLSAENVKRLRGVPDELFEATLDALLPKGVALRIVCRVHGLCGWAIDKR